MEDAVKDRYKPAFALALNDIHIEHTEVAFFENETGKYSFDDFDVRKVLKNSHYPIHTFTDTWGNPDEWCEACLEKVKEAITAVKNGQEVIDGPVFTKAKQDIIEWRDEQIKAVSDTKDQFLIGDKMLWNAKMRFGKTLCALELINQLEDIHQTLILTHRPAVREGWFDDYHKITFTHTYQYGSKNGTPYACLDNKEDFPDEYKTGKDLDTMQKDLAEKKARYIYFASMQDLRGKVKKGEDEKQWKENNQKVFSTKWDLVIFDEAHEGTQTVLGQEVIKNLMTKNSPKCLYLSGTPFNILKLFEANEMFTWDYVMEQREKEEWPKKHPGKKNPYEGLAKMNIYTYNLGDLFDRNPDYIKSEDDYFNFAEFFRIWTGDIIHDKVPLPDGVKIGHFVHEKDVLRFLDLLCQESPESYYPYSNEQFRKALLHTLWMLPGVFAAERLATLILGHKLHTEYGYEVVNVAGEGKVIAEADGDDTAKIEKKEREALTKVQKAIAKKKPTITLSCGRLTTGVSIPEWTGVFMLSGGYKTGAANYMQTIFRGQTPYKNGAIKTNCYAFDFAPDRTLTVIDDYIKSQPQSRNDHDHHDGNENKNTDKFLRFCAVIAMEGGREKEYDALRFIREVNECYAEHVVRNGFKSRNLFKNYAQFSEQDYMLISEIGKAIGGGKARTNSKGEIDLSKSDYDGENSSKGKKQKKSPTPPQTKKKKSKNEVEDKQKKTQAVLNEIFIRLPLLLFGAISTTEGLTVDDLLDKVIDDESWSEFMPKGLTKPMFRQISHLIKTDVLISSTSLIIDRAKGTDEMRVSQRVRAIAEMLKLFHFPDRETILTDWWVVNMHMTDTLGGYDFFDETHKIQLDEPRLVEQGDITTDVFCNPDTKILEINSKSGIYPLWLAYTLWKLIGEDGMTPEKEQKIWKQVVEQNLFVVTRTKMAEKITRRVLAGYKSDIYPNIMCIESIVEVMRKNTERSINELIDRITTISQYNNSSNNMKIDFDAIVSNPPYNLLDGGAGVSAIPIYNLFVDLAKRIGSPYISMIMPAKWYNSGRGLDKFRYDMLHDKSIRCLYDYVDPHDCFPTVDVAGGVCYFLRDNNYHGLCYFVSCKSGNKIGYLRDLSESEVLIRHQEELSILDKVKIEGQKYMNNVVYSQKPFGLRTYIKPMDNGDILLRFNGGIGPYNSDLITVNKNLINKWKIVTSRLTAEHAGETDKRGQKRIFSTLEILEPGTICTETYMLLCTFDNEEECANTMKYLKTRFVRSLIAMATATQQMSKASFRFVPFQDMSHSWTDADLYAKYGLSKEEIAFIESTIRPMDNTESV